jgi:hypothetical protein
VPPSEIGAQVVAWAQAMAAALYVSPGCGGHISYPDCYDTWYKASGTDYPPGVPTFPQAVIQYGAQVCPMTVTANAFGLWARYARHPHAR